PAGRPRRSASARPSGPARCAPAAAAHRPPIAPPLPGSGPVSRQSSGVSSVSEVTPFNLQSPPLVSTDKTLGAPALAWRRFGDPALRGKRAAKRVQLIGRGQREHSLHDGGPGGIPGSVPAVDNDPVRPDNTKRRAYSDRRSPENGRHRTIRDNA